MNQQPNNDGFDLTIKALLFASWVFGIIAFLTLGLDVVL